MDLSYHPQKTETPQSDVNQVIKKFCVKDAESWTQHTTLWHITGKARDLQDLVIGDGCVLFVRKEENQQSAQPEMPYISSDSLHGLIYIGFCQGGEQILCI